MERLFQARKLGIFPKLVLTFLAAIIPLFLIHWQTTQSGAEMLRTNLARSAASYVHYYLISFESELQKIANLQQQYINDDDFQKLSSLAPAMTPFERSRSILRVQNQLLLMKNSGFYVKEVMAYFPMLDRIIATSGYNEKVDQSAWDALADAQEHGRRLFLHNGQLWMGQLYPDAGLDSEPGFGLMIEFSTVAIRGELARIQPSDEGEVLLMGDLMDWDIAKRGDAGLLAGLRAYLAAAPDKSSWTGQALLKADSRPYYATYEYSALLQTVIAVIVPEAEVLGPLQSYQTRYLLQSIASILIVLVFSYWIYKLIHRPLTSLVIAFRQVERGKLNIRITHRNQDEFNYLYNQFNKMVGRLEQLIHEVYEQRIRSQKAELKQLQSQINPHFLYNSFFIVYRMAQIADVDSIKRLARHLSDYFQFIARPAADYVELDAEVKHACAYASIQVIRFRGKVRAEFDALPERTGAIRVPRLILQPILENAFQYGLEEKVAGGLLQVRFQVQDGGLQADIEDNGEQLTDSMLGRMQGLLAGKETIAESTGLANVRRRLQLAFGDSADMSIGRSAALGGLHVRLRIPYMEVDEIEPHPDRGQ